MTRAYLLGGILAVFLGLIGVIWWIWDTNTDLRKDIISLTIQRDACSIRVTNMSRDKESDDAIDNIPDSGLSNVPDGWILP